MNDKLYELELKCGYTTVRVFVIAKDSVKAEKAVRDKFIEKKFKPIDYVKSITLLAEDYEYGKPKLLIIDKKGSNKWNYIL